MIINSSTDKVFKDDNNEEIINQEQSIENEFLQAAHDSPPSSLPNVFSLAANTVKKEKKAETFEEVVALCLSQKNLPRPDTCPPIAAAVKMGRHDVVKFLIDQGESVNEATPDIRVWGHWTTTVYQHGSSPLELAIKQQDVEMVKLLTTYSPENRAMPELNYNRFTNVSFRESQNGGFYIAPFGTTPQYTVSSPLRDALTLGNQEIIDLVIKAYTDPQRLSSDYLLVQSFKQPEAMRSWIEQNFFLWKGEIKTVPDSILKIFMDIKDLNRSFSDLEILGWNITRQEFEQALLANDPQNIELITNDPPRQEDPFLSFVRDNRANLVMYLIENGKIPTLEDRNTAISHGAVDVMKILIEHGISSDGALSLAISQKQWPMARYLASLPKNIYEIIEICRSPVNKEFPPITIAVLLNQQDVVKFFIDHGESINSRTAGTPNWDYINEDSMERQNFGNTEGFTALEIAVKEQNIEIINLLMAHKVDPLFVRTTIRTVQPAYTTYAVASYSTPLSDAISTGNKEIVKILLKACETAESFFTTFEQIRRMQQADVMKTWIEHYAFLRSGVSTPVSDEVVQLLTMGSLQNAIMENNTSVVKEILESGWILSRPEVEKMLLSNNADIFALLLKHPYFGNEIHPVMMAVDLNRPEFIKASFEQSISIDGALLHAVKGSHKEILPALLELSFGKDEFQQAINQAYQMSAYDIMELLESHV